MILEKIKNCILLYKASPMTYFIGKYQKIHEKYKRQAMDHSLSLAADS